MNKVKYKYASMKITAWRVRHIARQAVTALYLLR